MATIRRRPPALSRGRKLGWTVCAGALACVLLAVGGEVVLRMLAARERPWRAAWYQEPFALVSREMPSLRPGHYVPTPGRYRPDPPGFDAWGFREAEIAVPKPPGRLRIVVIGDSVAFGSGLDDPADTAPEVLERRLRAERSPRYEVLNLGVPGYNALQLRHLVADVVLPRLEPDLIVYLLYANDVFDNRFVDWLFHDKLGFRIRKRDVGIHEGTLARLRYRLRSRGHLLSFVHDRLLLLKYRWRGSRLRDGYEKRGLSRDAGPPLELLDPLVVIDEEDTLAYYAIEEISARAADRGVPFVTFAVPQIEQEPPLEVSFVAELRERLDHVYGLTAALDPYTPGELTVSPTDTHPSVLGHRLIADAIYETLAAEHLLPLHGERAPDDSCRERLPDDSRRERLPDGSRAERAPDPRRIRAPAGRSS